MARTVMTPGWDTHLDALTSDYVEKVSEAVASDANRFAPRGRTGRLGRSYRKVRVSALVFHVGSDLDYAAAVELGARPHPIRVKSKKVLANTGTGEFFGKTVQHPGNRPRPHLRPALYRTREGL